MGKKSKRIPNSPRTCIFCGGRPTTDEHIWSDWLKDILPEMPDRWEGTKPVFNRYGRLVRSDVQYLKGKGSVKSKKAEVVCSKCNSGWMSIIVSQAKPFALQLINAEQHVLGEDGQRAIAKWIALSALMANQVAKTNHKFPRTDVDYFYEHKAPPPHWFIGIGHFSGARGVSANQASFAEWQNQTDSGERSVAFVKHAIAAIIGNLYTLVDANINTSHRLAEISPGPIYAPHIVNIQPLTPEGVPFPPPYTSTILGPAHFEPGTPAMEIARRFTERLSLGAALRGLSHI